MKPITSKQRYLDYRTACAIVGWFGKCQGGPITHGVLADEMAFKFGGNPHPPARVQTLARAHPGRMRPFRHVG